MAVKIQTEKNGSEKGILSIESLLQIPDLREMGDSSRKSEPMIRTPIPASYKINEELAKKWLANGAQPTDVVAKLFKAGRY